MASNDQQACYVCIQLPGTVETVPCALLKVRSLGAGAFEGTFTYGKRYLARPGVVALDPYHLPLSTRPHRFTKLKGIPGAVRDASADAWGRRVIQAGAAGTRHQHGRRTAESDGGRRPQAVAGQAARAGRPAQHAAHRTRHAGAGPRRRPASAERVCNPWADATH